MKQILLLILLTTGSILYAQNTVIVNTKQNEDKTVDFTYEKTVPGNHTLIITFRSLTNAFYTPTTYILSAPTGRLFSLKPSVKDVGISYSFNYRYIQGELKPNGVDTSFVYLLPFQKSKVLQALEQSNIDETFLKQARPKGWKSYQFRGDGLDSVFAVRKGIVVKVIDEFDYDTASLFTSKTNNVLIEHEDGSIAVYKRFIKGAIAVKEGQEVYPHSYLGSLGNASVQKNYLSVMIYYLSKTGFDENSRAEHTFITPVFLTSQGKGTLLSRQKYEVVLSDEVITKEMSRRQKKEFEKSKTAN